MPTKNQIPSGWEEKKLGDTLEKIIGGGTPSKEIPEYWNGVIPWVSVKDVVTHNANDSIDHISEDGLKNSSSRLIPKGILIVPTRMALGHAVFFNVDVAINQDLKALFPKKTTNITFIYYWFKIKKAYIQKLGNGTTVSGIQQSELKNINLLLPPLPEQKAIVEILETWDKMIEKLTQKITLKKQVKTGLMQNLLTGKVRISGFDGVWEEKRFESFVEVNPKTNIPVEKFNYIDLESVSDGTLCKTLIIEKNKAPSRAQRYLEKGDVLFQTVRPYQKNNYYFDLNGDYVASTGYAQLRSQCSQFVYQYIHSDQFVLKVLDRCTGSNYPAINSSDLKEITVCFPPLPEQQAIAKILTTCDEEINALKTKLDFITEQKKYLLSKLITGQIRVPEFETLPDLSSDRGNGKTLPDFVGTPLKGRKTEDVPSLPLEGGARRAEGI